MALSRNSLFLVVVASAAFFTLQSILGTGGFVSDDPFTHIMSQGANGSIRVCITANGAGMSCITALGTGRRSFHRFVLVALSRNSLFLVVVTSATFFTLQSILGTGGFISDDPFTHIVIQRGIGGHLIARVTISASFVRVTRCNTSRIYCFDLPVVFGISAAIVNKLCSRNIAAQSGPLLDCTAVVNIGQAGTAIECSNANIGHAIRNHNTRQAAAAGE